MLHQILRWLAWLIAISLLLLSLVYLSHIWMYIILSIILTFIGNPLVNLLSNDGVLGLKLNRSLAAVLSLICIAGLMSGIAYLIFPMLAAQALMLSNIQSDEIIINLEAQLNQMTLQLKSWGLWPSNAQWEQLTEKLLSYFSLENISSYFGGALSFTLDFLIGLFSVLFISFYMLKEGGVAARVIKAVTPDNRIQEMDKAIHETRKLLSRYFIGLLIQISIVAILIASGLSLLGVKYALTLGLLAGIFNLIPYIGPYIGGSLGVLIAISAELAAGTNTGLLPYGVKIMGIFVITQLIDNFVLQPIIFSKSVLAHPLEIFIVILIAGSLFGIIGMLAAIPVYTIFRVVARSFFSQTKWVRELTRKMDV
ncbi:MAG: AI-2E family transporter [Bacteroidia bacterium]